VRASGLVLDAIARNGTCESATVILHWFSGSADELRRAIEMGCLLSCGTRMLASSRGREYARQAPEERLLLETDLPSSPSPAFDPHDITHSLESAASSLAAIRGCDEAGLMDGLAERCGRILGM
jgi:TatD DNase family protein